MLRETGAARARADARARTSIGLTRLVAVPAAVTFGLAVSEYDLIRPPEFIGLDNFRELWNDDDLPRSRCGTP